MKPKLQTKERDVVKVVRDYLELNRMLYIRIHPTRPVGRQGKITFVGLPESQRGAPDFIVFHNRRTYALECKSSEGKQTQWQMVWAQRADREGIVYLIVRELQDFLQRL